MSSCNYKILSEIYNTIESGLPDIAAKLDDLDLRLEVGELDVDLDNLQEQLLISNQLKFLELVGIDIMTEEEQLEAYQSIKELIFTPTGSANAMTEEEGEF